MMTTRIFSARSLFRHWTNKQGHMKCKLTVWPSFQKKVLFKWLKMVYDSRSHQKTTNKGQVVEMTKRWSPVTHLALRMVSRQTWGAAGRASKIRAGEEGHGGSRGPLPWPRCGQLRSNRRISEFQGTSACPFCFPRRISSPRFFLCCLAASLRAVLSAAWWIWTGRCATRSVSLVCIFFLKW